MASLKDLRTRIGSVRSTRKITQAMKMVAASKLRRAQERAEESRPYALGMEEMVRSLASTVVAENAPPLLVGSGADRVHLLVVVTADRGLCGGFNASVVRQVRARALALEAEGRETRLYCIGRKGADMLRRTHAERIVARHPLPPGREVPFAAADGFARELLALFAEGAFDVCALHYNRFRSVMSQKPAELQVIPRLSAAGEGAGAPGDPGALHEFEPEEDELLAALLPRNLAVQIHAALLESAAGEQGARMTAMDSATRNAGDMISRLTLSYNRQRQAAITKELIEIISGSEAL